MHPSSATVGMQGARSLLLLRSEQHVEGATQTHTRQACCETITVVVGWTLLLNIYGLLLVVVSRLLIVLLLVVLWGLVRIVLLLLSTIVGLLRLIILEM